LVSSVPTSRTVGCPSAVGDLLTRPSLGRAQHGVADLRGAIAVFERRPVRRDVAVVADRGQEVVQPGARRCAPSRSCAPAATSAPRTGGRTSETRTVRKPCADAPGLESFMCTCSSLRRSRSKASEPLDPLISHVKRSCARGRSRERLDRPDRAVVELDEGLDGVVDVDLLALALGHEGLGHGAKRPRSRRRGSARGR
jgi:hypothetical protein